MPKSLLAFINDEVLRGSIESAALQLGYVIEFADFPSDVIDFLVARQPALVIVELGGPSPIPSLWEGRNNWRTFVIEAKTSPATRKLPILAIAPDGDAAVLLAAQKAGCDAVINHQSFLADAASLIAQYARQDDSAELLRQSQEPLPELAHTAIEQFNQREFFEQHETFEALWRAEPGPIRQLYQGLLQVGVAYLQIQRKNYVGARKLFQRAWQYLSALPDVCRGIDIAQVRADAQTAQAELERLGPERIAEFDAAFFKPIRSGID